MEERLKEVIGDVLDLDPGSIDASTTKDTTDSWDSLNHINLVVALEQEFQVSFDVAEIESMQTFTDILDTLEKKIRI